MGCNLYSLSLFIHAHTNAHTNFKSQKQIFFLKSVAQKNKLISCPKMTMLTTMCMRSQFSQLNMPAIDQSMSCCSIQYGTRSPPGEVKLHRRPVEQHTRVGNVTNSKSGWGMSQTAHLGGECYKQHTRVGNAEVPTITI